jgi:hypothetical protein
MVFFAILHMVAAYLAALLYAHCLLFGGSLLALFELSDVHGLG